MTDHLVTASVDMPHHDRTAREPDAHGQAALLLVESLIHALIARSLIDTPEAIEIVTIAAEVKEDIADEAGESAVTLKQSLALLKRIRDSLSSDLSHSVTGPRPIRD